MGVEALAAEFRRWLTDTAFGDGVPLRLSREYFAMRTLLATAMLISMCSLSHAATLVVPDDFQMENNIVADCGTALKVNQVPLPQWSSVRCNDVFDCATPYDGIADPTGTNGNIGVDPRFCDQSMYHLRQSSPCLPGQHPNGSACGVIGYSSVVCQPVRTEKKTWGQVKSLYR